MHFVWDVINHCLCFILLTAPLSCADRLQNLEPIFHCNARFSCWGRALVLTPREFRIGDANMLVFETLADPPQITAHPMQIAAPNANPRTPNASPNVSQWNIGCVGFPFIGAGVGHVQFFCVDFICVGWPTRIQFPVEYGL